MPIDWKAEAARLSKYWWGPNPPESYIYKDGTMQRGVGLLATGTQPGLVKLAWNLMLLEWGSYKVPTELRYHSAMVSLLVPAQDLARRNVEGHPLGTYTWLMTPGQFGDWVVSKPAFAVFGAEQTRRWAGLAKNLELAAA